MLHVDDEDGAHNDVDVWLQRAEDLTVLKITPATKTRMRMRRKIRPFANFYWELQGLVGHIGSPKCLR